MVYQDRQTHSLSRMTDTQSVKTISLSVCQAWQYVCLTSNSSCMFVCLLNYQSCPIVLICLFTFLNKTKSTKIKNIYNDQEKTIILENRPPLKFVLWFKKPLQNKTKISFKKHTPQIPKIIKPEKVKVPHLVVNGYHETPLEELVGKAT